MTTFLTRESTYPILPLILSRISYRSFSQERLTEEELMALFEAARWAPSSSNSQPWRFVYARRGEQEWNSLFNVLVDFNKIWCQNADTLVLVISRNHFEKDDKPSQTARFDTGAAWMNLALEAHARNIIAHAMAGFDYKAIKRDLHISDHFTVEAMIALGKLGNKESLPEKLRNREVASHRKPLKDIIAKGNFPFK